MIDAPLDTALGVDPGVYWWSGSQSGGTVHAANCSGWTSTSVSARTGVTSVIGPAWLDVWTGTGTDAHYVLGDRVLRAPLDDLVHVAAVGVRRSRDARAPGP